MNLRRALLAATVMALPVAAKAQPIDGLYVGAGAGYNYLDSVDVKNSNGVKLKGRDGGFIGLGSVGYGFGNGFRVELEGNYRAERMKVGGGGLSGSSDVQTYGAMVNGLFDFDVGANWIYPYVGAGVGYEWTQLSSTHATNAAGTAFTAQGTKGGFGVQGILGVAFPIPEAPGLSVTAEGRFMGVLDNENFSGTPVGVKLGNQYNYSGTVGLRCAFNAAPPVPPPAPAPAPVAAPAPAPSRTYLVFFDWDKADLTDRARQIIAEAARASTRVALTRIEVSGHADRTGSPAYNQKLSMRRAQNVAAELVSHGVPQNEIAVQAFGDTRPLVPTAAGVREPQNRRVEIVLK
jgi:outer membrane protein OmpA-like peptidoglycan-associated protein